MSQKPDDSQKKDADEEATEVAELAAIDSEELLKGGRALKKEGVARTQIGEDLLEGGAEKKEKAKKAADEAAGLPGFLAKKEAADKQAAKKQAAEDDAEDEIPLEGARPDQEPGIGTEGEVELEKADDSPAASPGDNSTAPEAKKAEDSDEKAGAAKASGTEKQKDTP